MTEWYSLAELADAKLPGLPDNLASLTRHAEKHGWLTPHNCRIEAGKTKPVRKICAGVLPAAARSKLAFLRDTGNAETVDAKNRSKRLWQRFEVLSKAHKEICQQRLDVLVAVDDMVRAGIALKQALAYQLPKSGVSERTYHNWRSMVSGEARADWLAALAPSFSPAASGVISDVAECHPDAWDVLKSDYLRPERPAFTACYRRMVKAAGRKGWSPIPSERTLRRRLEAEVPKAAQILAREGKRKAEQLFPAQTRSKGHLHAMEITNTDGHQIDLFVDVPWQDLPTRVILLGIQDVYSAKILSHVIAESETWEAVRTCVGAMIENEGGKLPDHLYMDNGRAFASKKISGGARRRNRYKIDENEVAGLLKTLGIEPHFTKPYSGRSKPIERAWRDLAEEISKHPAMAGAYTGNKPDAKPENYRDKAIPLDVLQAHAAAIIAEHNARPGRTSPVARGRSFNEVFEESVLHPSTIIRQASPDQRALWLLASEPVTARKPSGQIHYQGNIYWAPALNEYIGKRLSIRFDPHKLHDPVKVYDADGRFVCDAECREAAGFSDAAKARRHEKDRRTFEKHNKAIADLHRKKSAEELAEIYAGDALIPPPIVRPVVTRLVTGNAAVAAAPEDEMSQEEFSSRFRDGLARLMGDDAAIIPFPQGDNTPPAKAGRGKMRAEK
jgi:transposase InsO family protein